jgi:hypothetical protein
VEFPFPVILVPELLALAVESPHPELSVIAGGVSMPVAPVPAIVPPPLPMPLPMPPPKQDRY